MPELLDVPTQFARMDVFGFLQSVVVAAVCGADDE